MIYLFIIFHILIFLESYVLFTKRQRKSSIYLGITNIILIIINSFRLVPILYSNNNVSSIIQLTDEFINNPIINILWVLLNIFLIGLTLNIIKKARNQLVQNKILEVLIYIFNSLIIFIYILIIFHNLAAHLLFIIIIVIQIYLIKKFILKKENYILAIILILLVFLVYSYGTYIGAARLQIALKGYIVDAYETGLEELKYYNEENIKKYVPVKEIPVTSGDMGIIEVKNYIIIKFGTYYGY